MADVPPQTATEPWKIYEPIDDSDTDDLVFLGLIVALPWFIGVIAILGGIVWCGLHDV
jgi:hypothetical protein